MRSKEKTVLSIYFLLLVVFLIWTVIDNKSMTVPFTLGLAIIAFLLVFLGYPHKDVLRHLWVSILSCRKLYIIIALMGITISLWLFSGVVPSMIVYSLPLLTQLNIVLMCFLITAFFSLVIGSALGSVSTFGIALLAIGVSAEIPAPILLGAIVSGSFMADRLSPVAGLVNLNLAVHKTTFIEFLKASIGRVLIIFILSSIGFYLLGLPYQQHTVTQMEMDVLDAIHETFFVSPYMLFVPLFVIVLSLLRMPTIMLLSSLAALCGGISLIAQNETGLSLVEAVLWGYHSTHAVLAPMLKGGGLIPFLEVLLIVACAVGISHLFEMTDTYQLLANFFLKRVMSQRTLLMQMGMMSIVLTSITCDQTMGIVAPARLYQQKSLEYDISPAICGAAIADTGVIIAPLEPWNVNTLVITAMTGVSVFEYGPYVLFLWGLIIAYFSYAYLVRVSKVNS